MLKNLDIDEIIKKLSISGQVIAMKTDTVYGLICNAYDKVACNKIYEIKKRDIKKPLSIFIKSIDEIGQYVDNTILSEKVVNVMKKYWPGKLTIILKKKQNLFNYLTCGFDTIGIRIPNDRQLLEILKKVDFPLAETSCNLSGEKEYCNANEIREKLGNTVDLIIDGGEINKNIPSTVIEIVGDEIKVIRQGAILIDE